MKPINILEKFSLFTDKWSPKIISEVNNQLVKLAKIEGEFVWHNHADEDELFLVFKGELTLKFRDSEITLKEGDMYVIPKGVDHLPIAKGECWVLLIESKGTKHTGDVVFEGTVNEEQQDWI